jgi:hypothetical protein
VKEIKSEIDVNFAELKSQGNLYLIKKSLRRILRVINKYCKYIGDKAVSAELHIYFCMKIKENAIPVHKSVRLENLYLGEIKKIKSFVASLHEDLQHDYAKDLEQISG